MTFSSWTMYLHPRIPSRGDSLWSLTNVEKNFHLRKWCGTTASDFINIGSCTTCVLCFYTSCQPSLWTLQPDFLGRNQCEFMKQNAPLMQHSKIWIQEPHSEVCRWLKVAIKLFPTVMLIIVRGTRRALILGEGSKVWFTKCLLYIWRKCK